MERQLQIQPRTAIYVLQSLSWLSSEAKNALEPLMIEIRAIAQGD